MLVKFGNPSAKRRHAAMNNFFNQDFDKLFKGFEKGLENMIQPATNIKEGEDAFEIELSVPGFKKEDFKLKLDNDLLTISAKIEEKKSEEKTAETTEKATEKTIKYTRREFQNRSFSRTFTLPETILADKINAKYDSGILTVSVPKNKVVLESKHREITVG